MSSYRMNTNKHDDLYFFHVEGVELPVELREKLVEISRDPRPPTDQNFANPEIWQDIPTRDIGQVLGVIRDVQESPANEGLNFPWFAHTPEMKRMFDLLHKDALVYLQHVLLQTCEPEGCFSPHIDNMYGEDRKTNMFFPLTPYDEEEWAPLHYYPPNGEVCSVGFSPCYVGATQKVHGFENNDNHRAVCTFGFSCEIEVLYTLYTEGRLLHER